MNPHEVRVVVINSARPDRWLKDHCRLIDWPALDLGDESRNRGDPFKGNVTLVPVSSATSYHGAVAVRVRGGSGRILVSGPIADESGRPVPGVEGWSVYRIAQDYTMVYRGDHLLNADRPRVLGRPVRPALSDIRPGPRKVNCRVPRPRRTARRPGPVSRSTDGATRLAAGMMSGALSG